MPDGVNNKKKKTSVTCAVRAADRVHVFPRTSLNFCAPLQNAEVGLYEFMIL